MTTRLHRNVLPAFIVLALGIFLAGCDGLLSISDRRPNNARVVITGSSDVPLRLITSTSFTAELNQDTGIYDIAFASFESEDLPLPSERQVRLNTDRFMARVYNITEEEAQVTMEVYFDGQLVYRQEATLVDSFLDFIHVFF